MSPVQATQAMYQLFATGQIEEMLTRFVDADSVLDNPLPAPIPFGGLFKGPQGFIAYAQCIFAAIQIEQFDIDEIFADGERVTVVGRETSHVLATGKRYQMDWVHEIGRAHV